MPSDPSAAFRTHANYLEAYCIALHAVHGPTNAFGRDDSLVLHGVRDAVLDSPIFQHLDQRANGANGLEASFFNAWGTELLMSLTNDFATGEMLGFANNWGVVQLYYSTYHVTRALALGLGETVPGTHAQSRKFFASFWTKRARTGIVGIRGWP